ncbi:Hemolysin-type calcium-binding repeat-containing protein [Pseudooceanicola nitratireducens]|jgi:Ca2+-binding RTX toxin-like protein|uniref:Hemolysin-type calcium-binding repeat-containing protein n=1 Tax=Pseudooceanicola nitratireducens TaxID=517719 RepID=A0A1I1I2K1_9RHOB|nr:calcium-binding protein [Pseudooceanicola nitratireducens]SEJ16472.1 Hemolysin-type calcium-binding repeat-containing protein [Pseudooceanicola nitratireducens]SFC28448.1 Hemolysin-type calcium-binding repeat-containing protein [Pseudooceanicola nitratireducens]
MFMLAGLMGLMLVGASAFVGLAEDDVIEDLDPLPEDEDEAPMSPHALLELVGGEIYAGTDAGDAVQGSPLADQIGGYSGDDTLNGGSGDDILVGMAGDDQMDGQAGADTLHGGDGGDRIYGSSGDDSLFGHMGQDLLAGGIGNDVMHGGAGYDSLLGGSGDDALHGGLGGDQLTGGAGQDTLFGASGDDWINGVTEFLGQPEAPNGAADFEAGRDFLNGGAGADTVIGGAGDVLTLGAGTDTAVLGHWIGVGDDAAQVTDFLAGEDQLIVICPDDAGDAQDVTIDRDGGETRITLNGVTIATLPQDIPIGIEDVVVLPESAAQSLLR